MSWRTGCKQNARSIAARVSGHYDKAWLLIGRGKGTIPHCRRRQSR